MRNKVQLYIEGLRADLDDGSFLLLNYTQEDLSNPTIVRNSFSKQITLKGTPANDEIFGHLYRNDRNTLYGSPYTGPYFDPCRKTSFVLYNEANEILESGYLKLDSIDITRRKRSYKVTLFGGLGSFLYGLSYDSNGDKLTLADLDFGETLDFTINRNTVSDAWARLDGDTSKAAKWDILNFAPVYGGLPPSPFDANKCLVKASVCGLPASNGEFSAQDGWTLVTLSEKVTGNDAKDYRSYLQKPVIKLSAVIDAICDPANNGGYTVNQDAEFFDASNPYWADAWLTLPMLNDLNINASSASGTFTVSSLPYTYTIPDGGNLSISYGVNMQFGIQFSMPPALTQNYYLDCFDDWLNGVGFYLNYVEFTITLYDSADVVVDTIIYRVSTAQPDRGYPQMDDLFDYIDGATGIPYKNGVRYKFSIPVSEYGINKVKISATMKSYGWGTLQTPTMPWTAWLYGTNDASTGEPLGHTVVDLDESSFEYVNTNSSTVRTGASITAQTLLGGSNTPADYLLSFCKMFGIQMVVHKDSKTVDLKLRKNLYSSSVTDISGRVDRARGITKKPFAFDARWYLFGNEAIGDYADYYASKFGRPYGQFRVNTGYEFDASDKRLTDGILFRNVCDVLETGKYYCDLLDNGQPIPALFLGGGKYSLYKGGESKDFDIPYPVSAVKTWNNATYPMHDDWTKLQLHGKENAHLDERDTLVFFGGCVAPASSYVTLSDDLREMLTLNGNNPCWLPHYCEYDASWKVSKMPRFTRYVWNGTDVDKSMDFGTPMEAQIPGVVFTSGSDVFTQYWEKYIADRYDDDSAVITAYVDLRGFQVNENLFRQFYAFDGAIWALNRIIDHSLTTFGPTKCEFVKVQDKTNYTTY